MLPGFSAASVCASLFPSPPLQVKRAGDASGEYGRGGGAPPSTFDLEGISAFEIASLVFRG